MADLHYSVNSNGVGVTVSEVNVVLDMTPKQLLTIQELLNKYKVVVFPDQKLTDKQLEKFAYLFGQPFISDKNQPVLGSQDSPGSIVIVGNKASEYTKSYLGNQEVLPHSDHQWLERPSSSSMLYAVDINKGASSTVWYNMVKIYKSLDSKTQALIQNLSISTYNPFFRPFGSVSSKYVDRKKDIPPGVTFPHPLVRTHPLTNEKILYLNLAYELEIPELTYSVGSELLLKLSEHIKTTPYKYEHHWKNDDLVFWDNRATIHYRPAFDSRIRRVLKRVTLDGELPI